MAEQIANITPNLETFIGKTKGEQTPPSLQKLVRHTGVLYDHVVILTVVCEPVPSVSKNSRMEFTQLDEGFYRIVLRYGFMQKPNIPPKLKACEGLAIGLNEVQYIIGSVDLLAGRRRDGMARWRVKLFAFMARNTHDVTATYHLPVDQIITVGFRVSI
jgi:KUP system potassium uptake protein